jgi:predicted  nucleic acid-binding Zn-ribbon protein
MDFLKSILGDDLFSQVENKVNAYNSDEANKDKQIKIANLASGEYTSKNKFTDLETEKENIASQLSAANKVIEDLRKATKTDEDLQKKVTAYESKIQTLNEELKVTKTENALKFALAQAGAAEDLFCLHYRAKKCKIISVIMIERGESRAQRAFRE